MDVGQLRQDGGDTALGTHVMAVRRVNDIIAEDKGTHGL